MSVCLMDEQDARDQIVKDWANYPAIAKERCAQPKEYLPGYIEWQACLDLTRDVLKLRREDAPSTSGSTTGRPECPVVKYTEDGSIDYVINCPALGL
jgi:hypothetical protein